MQEKLFGIRVGKNFLFLLKREDMRLGEKMRNGGVSVFKEFREFPDIGVDSLLNHSSRFGFMGVDYRLDFLLNY